MEISEPDDFLPIKRPKSSKRHSSSSSSGKSFSRRSAGHSRPRSLSVTEKPVGVPHLTLLVDMPTSMSVDSSTTTSPTSNQEQQQQQQPLKLSPTVMEAKTRHFMRSSSGGTSNVTDSRERLTYTTFKDGLLNKNKRALGNVDFCFRCNHQVSNQSDLVKSTEKTGYKLATGTTTQIPVYRSIFLCTACVVWFHNEKSGDTIPCIKITSEALEYF